MRKYFPFSILFYTIFAIFSTLYGGSPSVDTKHFLILWVFILLPLAALISAIPVGYRKKSFRYGAFYAIYAALIGELSYLAAFHSFDGESFLMTVSMAVIGVGLGGLIRKKQKQRRLPRMDKK